MKNQNTGKCMTGADGVSSEDLDCRYCDECKGFVVYKDIARYDFKRMEFLPGVKLGNLDGWEEYIAVRDREFEKFQEFYAGKNPIEAIEQYDFTYRPRDYQQAYRLIFEYIEAFYNTKRIHSHCNYMLPNDLQNCMNRQTNYSL